MSILTPEERRARAEADALLAREYEALKREVVRTVAGKLAATGVQLPEADLDAVYNLAWHALHTKLAGGEEVANRTGLLVSIAHRRALDEHRAAHPSRRADPSQLDELPREDEVAERLDDVTELRQFVAGLRERLDRRELEAAALCYVYEYTRPEAARAIGVQPKRMEKIMDAVSKKISPLLGEIRAGAWCEQHRSLMTAYALELLEPGGERHRMARDHLDGCSSCRRSVLRARGIAAVAPPLPLLVLAGGVVGAGVVGVASGAGAGAASGAAGGAGSGAAGGGGASAASGAAGGGGAGAAAGGGHGAGAAASHGLAARAKVAAAVATVVVVAAAVAAAFALDLVSFSGSGSKPPEQPALQTTRQRELARARAERAARARARARAVARAQARREAARRRARRRAAASATTAAASTTRAATPPRQEEAPAATPPPAATPAPEPTPPAADPTPQPTADDHRARARRHDPRTEAGRARAAAEPRRLGGVRPPLSAAGRGCHRGDAQTLRCRRADAQNVTYVNSQGQGERTPGLKNPSPCRLGGGSGLGRATSAQIASTPDIEVPFRMSVPMRLRAALLTLAACLGLLTLLTLPGAARAAGSPDLTGEINSPTVLHGERVPVSISTTNPSGGAYGYNVSFRVVLPAGVSYSAGAPVAPTTVAGPGAGETTLIFRNVNDISQNATESLDFEVVYDTSRYDVGDRFTIQAQAFANDNARWIPRFDAAGLPIGPAADSYTGYTAVLNGVTTINAIDIEKDEPSWEGEILRGVHDHQTTYTLTVRNNGIRRTDGVTVVDYLPAGLEFLGCAANPDNTTNAPTNTGTRVEYPGAGAIVVGAVSDCVAPSRVETVNVDPDGAGPLPSAVYTRVEWSLGTFPSTTTRRISYRAAIPIRENTMTWSGGSAPAITGAQAVNLDNNNGPETRDEQQLTNYATAAGQYNGTVAVRDEDWLTRTAEDWVVHKETDTPDLVQGGLTTWTLTFQTSEYRSVRDAVVRDTVPSGLCPVGPVNYTTGNSSSPTDNDDECRSIGVNPTQPYSSRPVENADGTFTVTWDKSTFPQLAQTDVNQTFTVRFPTITRTRYQSNFNGTTPILTRDTVVNRVTTDADQIVRCIAPGTPDCTTVGPEINHDAGYGTGVSIPDASEASELAARPAIKKRVGQAGTGTDCRLVTYIETIPTYHPGDRVCWLLSVTFPTGVDTNPQVISDLLPAGTRYELGSDAAYDPPTGRNTVTSTIDESAASGGVLNWTVTGGTVPRGDLVFERTISTIVGPSGTTAQNGEVLGNLMKFAARNTAGISEPLRDQRDIVVETPVLDLLKGIDRIDRAGTPVVGPLGVPNVDGRTVQAGDRVTYRVDVSNTGGQDAERIEVWDLLPSDYDCLFVSVISDGGICVDGGLQPDRIVWTDLAIAAGDDATLTYTTIVPSDVGPNRRINNTAGVRTYAGRTNLNTYFDYYPANNIDPSGTSGRVNAPAADDPSWVVTNPATVAKSRTTEVNSSADGNDDTQATIGELINYRVDVTIPAGTTIAADALLTDVLDSQTRQAYVGGSATLSFVGPGPSTPTIDTTSGTPGIRFTGGYAVPVGNVDEVITLRFSVRVADVAGNSRTAGNLTNRASLTWTDPEEGAKRADSATVNTQIVEPLIGQTKVDDRRPNRVVPGEIVEYTLTTTNSRTPGRISTAHDVALVDRVPVGVTPISAAPGNAPLADGATIPGSTAVWNSAARTITYSVATLAPGATATLRYRVSVDDPAIGGALLRNTVDTTAASLETGHTGRRTTGTGYAASANDTLQIQGASVTKNVTPGRATVGEHVDYTVVVTIPPNVSLYDVTVTDLLPDTIGFDRFTGSACVSGACPTVQEYDPVRNGDGTTTIAWDLGDIAAPLSTPAVLRLTYQGHVLARDRANGDVVAGDTGVNAVNVGTNRSDRETFDRTDIPTGFEDVSPDARATFTVIEPRVSIDKQVSVDGGAFGDGPATAQSDDALEYEITVRNSGDGPAYDLTIEDTPDAELTDIVLGTPSSGSARIVGSGIVWQVDGPVAAGASVRLRYSARLIAASGLSDGQSIDNTARVPSYWGQPRSERTDPDNGGIVYREYTDGGSDSTRVVLDFPTLTLDKTTGLSGFPDRGRAQVGVSFPWRVTVRNTSTTATASNVVVTDTLPENWGYVAGSATLTPAAPASRR